MVLPEGAAQNGSTSESTSKAAAKRERRKNIKKLKIYSDILSAALGPAVIVGSGGNSYKWEGGPNHF